MRKFIESQKSSNRQSEKGHIEVSPDLFGTLTISFGTLTKRERKYAGIIKLNHISS